MKEKASCGGCGYTYEQSEGVTMSQDFGGTQYVEFVCFECYK